MSKRKTLKQKKQIQTKKTNRPSQNTDGTINYQEIKQSDQNVTNSLNGKRVSKDFDDNSLLLVDSSYIKQDLIKTLIISLVFIGSLILLYYLIEKGTLNLFFIK